MNDLRTLYPPALRLLAHYWLNEVQLADLVNLEKLPALGTTLPSTPDAAAGALDDLAIEYQRLFGFNLPPYESLYVDPAVMLDSPATARVRQLYLTAGWQSPGEARTAAPDHLGLELLALADLLENASPFAAQLWQTHLALWIPVYTLDLARQQPHPFYAVLGELTREIVLAELVSENLPPKDPFPDLPPPPTYRASLGEPIQEDMGEAAELPRQTEPESENLRKVLQRLLTPCRAGLYLTRQDIHNWSRQVNLPAGIGERSHTLSMLFKLAGQYDALSELLAEFKDLLQSTDEAYAALAQAYPAWEVYAQAWRQRLGQTQAFLTSASLELSKTSFT